MTARPAPPPPRARAAAGPAVGAVRGAAGARVRDRSLIFGAVAVAGSSRERPERRAPTNPPVGLTLGAHRRPGRGVRLRGLAHRRPRARARRGPDDFGLRRGARSARRSAGWRVVYVALRLAAACCCAIFGSPPDQELVTDLKHEDSFAVLVGFAVLTCIVAPFAEEFFFRGFMFTRAARAKLGAGVGGADRRRWSSGSSTRPALRLLGLGRAGGASEWACACSTGGHSPLFRAWRCTRSTTRSPSARPQDLDRRGPSLGLVVRSASARSSPLPAPSHAGRRPAVAA